MLEQKYIWRDSICIISDDATDKAMQIPQMARIYGGVLLTVIAAAGQDANHGLAGLHVSRTEYSFLDVGACHIV